MGPAVAPLMSEFDTHGWLEGHIKEQNYGADWGDFVSFSRHMKHKADSLDVDLLLIDTGDLHDGAGLSDATIPNGLVSNPIFENIDYDLLTIGNHELYLSDIAYFTADQFAKYYGDRYVSSNVQIYNNATGSYEDIANKYRYFTTQHGLRIMAFGVLFDFTGNSNASKVIPAKTMVKEQWFLDAVNYDQPVDMFVLFGHNPVKDDGSTLTAVYNVIRSNRPDIPIQVFGGHTHIRDFAVYDRGATGLESGRYCETLGWLSMSGIKSSTFNGTMEPRGVPHPSQPAVNVTKSANATATVASSYPTGTSPSDSFSKLVYSRKYLDWNRLTFAYHAVGSQSGTFDYQSGRRVTTEITQQRTKLNLTALYGCAPQTYCQFCKPFGDPDNIYTPLTKALSTIIVNEDRKETPRLIICNTGSVRFDLVEGPFTRDDSYIVSPFHDSFQYIANVPYSQAKQVLGLLNKGSFQKRNLQTRDFGFSSTGGGDDCVDAATSAHNALLKRSANPSSSSLTRPLDLHKRDTLVPGYTTTDDFGTDGDDTAHSTIPSYKQPNDFQANASFPTDGSDPETVDMVFLDFIGEDYVVPALNSIGANYTAADIQQYLPKTVDTNSYVQMYAQVAWQANVPNCPVGQGVGFGNN
ncbi:MAG: hypothetical protein MMC23_000672 [Stictis urceolatum]|nr:hypothetical protein [Stictis urceolata]